jgi:hypothetical protein
MVLVHHDAQYELTLQAETLCVSGLALPKPADNGLSQYELRLARLESLRHFSTTLDLLFQAFLSKRTGTNWNEEAHRIRRWLQAA